MADMVQRQELGAFLRSRREATDPVTLGLQPGTRRRTPGLRREELAQLAGVSVTWYTWLEQGRDIGVSRQVIDSLARVLAMTPAERAHLFTIAGLAQPPRQDAVMPHADDALRRLVTALAPNPAYVINPWWDLMAYNCAYAALAGGLEDRPSSERNVLWLTFTDKNLQDVILDWPAEARQLAGQLRVNLARYPGDPRGAELLAALQGSGSAFADYWDEHVVTKSRTARKRFRHPDVGRLDLDYVKLTSAENDQQQLVAFLPASEADAGKLELLR
jgi:transcriptional regulator with XRE-family HTH domain